jgi:chromosome segregation ATPase
MATISVRAQLLVGRLQLQEQRINVLAAQVNDVRRLIDIKQSGQVPLTLELKRSEEASRSGSVGSEEQKHLEDVVPRLKAQLGQMQKEEQQLHLQETELSNQLATEQGRWIDFNSRLDELERQLPQSHR